MSFDWATLERKFDGLPSVERPVLFTVAGTAAQWWEGFPADLARALGDELVEWQPIWYPAATFPMGKSIAAGRAELVKQLRAYAGRKFMLSGYSQGQLVVGQVYKYDLLAEDGVLHDLLPNLIGAANFGGPMREAGTAYPGASAKHRDPKVSGISPDRLEDTPSWWHEYFDTGDLYAATPLNATGEYQRAFFNLIVGPKIIGTDTIIEQLIELNLSPVPEAIAAAFAAVNAIRFFGQMTRPHIEYHLREARPGVTYLQAATNHLRALALAEIGV